LDLDAFLADVTKRPMSGYLLGSRSLTLNDTMRDMLSSSGLPNPFLRPMVLEGAVEQLTQRTEDLVSMLNTGSSEARGR
jgi:hypothetical protein